MIASVAMATEPQGSNDDGETTLGQGKYLKLVVRRGWEFVHRFRCTGVVIIVAITPERRVLLVEQFRPAVDNRVIELPAGLVGDTADWPDERLIDAAHRELIEETGYQAGRFTQLAEAPTSVGMSSERLTFFQAHDLTRVGAGGGDDSESIVVHEVPLDGLRPWLAARDAEGTLIDHKIYAGLFLAGPEPAA
jgi:ADP-ribose pyrophosphatase